MMKVGTLESVKFTQGGAGNQWTTIDGVRYATWWDIRSKNIETLEPGAKVVYRPYKAALWAGDLPIDQADVARIYPNGDE